MEGVASEAASLAGHLGLGKLIYLYDDNHISIEGCTDLAFTEDVGERFEAYGWQVHQGGRRQRPGGHRPGHRRGARRDEQALPHHGAHHHRLRQPEQGRHAPRPTARRWARTRCRLTKEALGWPADLFFAVPERVREQYAAVAADGAAARARWEELFARYEQAYPDLAAAVEGRHGAAGCPRAGRTSCRSSPPARASPPGRPRARC